MLVLADKADPARALRILQFDEKLRHRMDVWSPDSVYRMYQSCVSFYDLFRRFEKSTYRDEPETQLV